VCPCVVFLCVPVPASASRVSSLLLCGLQADLKENDAARDEQRKELLNCLVPRLKVTQADLGCSPSSSLVSWGEV